MITSTPFGYLNYAGKLCVYAGLSTGYLNMEAVFSDETDNYVAPADIKKGDSVSIKLRTARDNAEQVYLHARGEKLPMSLCPRKEGSQDIFDYYYAEVGNVTEKLIYYFTIIKNGREYFYNKKGLYDRYDENYNLMLIPDFSTPDWARGAVMYQIYVDRFNNGDTSNDVANNEYAYLGRAAKHIENWNQDVEADDICNFYGGDLKGVADKIGYLKELGVEVIYLNPIFVSPSNHKYDIQDYDYVDPHYGVIVEDGGEPLYFEKFHNRYATMYMRRTTNRNNLEASNAFMASVIRLAHDNGIRVILDGVFNHCGAFNKWMDKAGFYSSHGYQPGAYATKNSPYHDYFRWYDDNWPNNDCYDAWWGHDNHPKLNYDSSRELYDYILGVGAKWVSPPYNADGWRLDVAADLGYSKETNHRFWRDFRKAVKTANPNAIILAEQYGDPYEWLQGDQWDTVMNYVAFMDPITWFLTGMEKHSEEYKPELLSNAQSFESSMRFYMARLSKQSLFTAMNQLSNHDHSRFLTRTNMTVGRLHTKGARAAETGLNKGIMMEAVVFQMTWPGAPTLYYGDEAGLPGWTDPDNRRPYPWGAEDTLLLSFHKEIIKIHRTSHALRYGSLEYLLLTHGVLSYGRWMEDKNGGERIAVVLNNNDHEVKLCIPVWKIGVGTAGTMVRLICTDAKSFSTKQEYYQINNGCIEISVQAFGSETLREVRS